MLNSGYANIFLFYFIISISYSCVDVSQASVPTTDASSESAVTTPQHSLRDANNPAGYFFCNFLSFHCIHAYVQFSTFSLMYCMYANICAFGRLLSIAEETLAEFLSKATGTAVDWVQMPGMKV